MIQSLFESTKQKCKWLVVPIYKTCKIKLDNLMLRKQNFQKLHFTKKHFTGIFILKNFINYYLLKQNLLKSYAFINNKYFSLNSYVYPI